MENITVYHTIDSFNKEFGMETFHPLIHIVNMSDAPVVDIKGRHTFDFYSVYLKDSSCGTIKYGLNYYDYQDGTLLFVAPGQVMHIEEASDEEPAGWVLMFHSDLLRGTQLGHNLKNYTFFQYSINEALHLSAKEREIILGCFHNIETEVRYPVDSNSKDLIVSNLELFLNYSRRFYERQFITRSQVVTDTLSRFEEIVENYFTQGLARSNGTPTVKYCAERMNASPNYLSDMLRKETGKSALEHIHLHLIDHAKEMLSHNDKTISEIAFSLGFEYPQYFSRLFKKRVGISPAEYRTNCN